MSLVLIILLSVVIINIPALTTEQALSSVALRAVLFSGCVWLWNSYKKSNLAAYLQSQGSHFLINSA